MLSSAALAGLGVIGMSLLLVRVPPVVWIAGATIPAVAAVVTALALMRERTAAMRPSARSAGLVSWTGTLVVGLALTLALHAASIALSFAIVASIVPIAAPLSILAALFVGIEQPAEVAIAASLLARGSLLLTTLIGAGLLVSRRSAGLSPSRPPAGGDVLPG